MWTISAPEGLSSSAVTPALSVRLRRFAYRVGYPIASIWWLALWLIGRRGKRGAKCLLTSDGEVLLVRHTYGRRRLWDLPGGLLNRGEEPLAGAQRELDEELDVQAELREIASVEFRILGRRDRVHLFAAELDDRAVDPDRAEIAEVAWFTAAGLPPGIEPQIRAAVVDALSRSRVARDGRR
jgi:8-oxo-dGTP pyrophosphatase MutT (NUDIX family)